MERDEEINGELILEESNELTRDHNGTGCMRSRLKKISMHNLYTSV